MQPDTCDTRSRRLPLIGAIALGALGAYAQSQPAAEASIQRLDGTTLSASEADAFAAKTLAAMHVTGAELALINRGHLVWSLAYGQRRKDPPLPMDLMTEHLGRIHYQECLCDLRDGIG